MNRKNDPEQLNSYLCRNHPEAFYTACAGGSDPLSMVLGLKAYCETILSEYDISLATYACVLKMNQYITHEEYEYLKKSL